MFRRSTTALDQVELDGDGVAVAVCLLFSYLNPEHELRVREAIDAASPGAPGFALARGRADLAGVRARHHRDRRRVHEAALRRLRGRRLDEALEEAGAGGSVVALKSNGGRAVASEARSRPAHLLLSGIAGGAHRRRLRRARRGGRTGARARHGRNELRRLPDPRRRAALLVATSSSSSASRSACRASRRGRSARAAARSDGSTPAASSRSGPQSAGAVPGPACYGRGGEEATITDAEPRARPARSRASSSAGSSRSTGRSPRRARRLGDAARPRARDRLGHGAGLQREHGERDPHRDRRAGHRPARAFALVAFGGAGPTHAVRDRRRASTCAACSCRRARALLGLRRARRERPRRRRAQRLSHRPARRPPRSSARSSLELEARARGRTFAAQGLGRGARACAARSRCATRARTTSRRSPCRTATLDDGRRSRDGRTPSTAALYEELLRLSPRRHPDRARPALGVVAMGEPRRVRRLPERARRRRRPGGAPRRLLPRDRLRADAGIVRREALGRAPSATGAAHRRVDGLDRRRPARLDARGRSDGGILEP